MFLPRLVQWCGGDGDSEHNSLSLTAVVVVVMALVVLDLLGPVSNTCNSKFNLNIT